MKRTFVAKKTFWALTLVFSLALTLSACGGGSSSTPSNNNNNNTGTTGSQAASTSNQAATVAQGSSDTFNNLGQIGLSSIAGAPAVKLSPAGTTDAGLAIASRLSADFAQSGPIAAAAAAMKQAIALKASTPIAGGTKSCSDNGSYTYSGSADYLAGTVTINVSFSGCRENGDQYDGVMTLNANINLSTGSTTITQDTFDPNTANSDLTVKGYSANYAAVTNNMTAHIAMTITSSATTTTQTSIAATGTLTTQNVAANTTYTMNFNNFQTVVTAGASDINTVNNGSFTETWTESGSARSMQATFTNFGVDIASVTGGENVSLTGTAALVYSPATVCAGGTTTFHTVTPIHYDNATGATTLGEIQVTVNAATTNIVYNADGTITVTDANGNHVNYTNEFDLAQVCDFSTLN